MTGSLCRRLSTKHFISLGSDINSVVMFSRKYLQKNKKIYLVPISILEIREMCNWYIHWQISPCLLNSDTVKSLKFPCEMSALSMKSEDTWLHQHHSCAHRLKCGWDLTSDFPFCILIFAWCNFLYLVLEAEIIFCGGLITAFKIDLFIIPLFKWCRYLNVWSMEAFYPL